jgi:glycosyltransferase involved in cell wall biosynthesis
MPWSLPKLIYNKSQLKVRAQQYLAEASFVMRSSRLRPDSELVTVMDNLNIKQVLIVSPGYPKWDGDSRNPMVRNLARLFARMKIEVCVITAHYPTLAREEIMDGVVIRRVRYAFPESFERLGSAGGIIDDLRGGLLCKVLLLPFLTALAIKACLEARTKDLILAQWVPTILICLPAKLAWRKPLVVNSRTYPDTAFWRLSYKILLRFADGVIFNSNDNMAFTNRIFQHPCTAVIGSGIDLGQYPMTMPARPNRLPWKLITVARMVEFKGLEYAIRAIHLLRIEGRDIMFTVVGDGPLRQHLQSIVNSLDLQDRIVFAGSLPHRQIPQVLLASDIFLLPSIVDSHGRTEGFGAVLLEAMAAGLPIIASIVGGIVDIVDANRGILVPEKDPQAIAGAVKQLMDDADLRGTFADNGFRFVRDEFSDEMLTEKYRLFLTRLFPIRDAQ